MSRLLFLQIVYTSKRNKKTLKIITQLQNYVEANVINLNK